MATLKRKAKTTMVVNPNRGLSIGGRTTVRKAAKRNPVRKTAAPVANPRKRRRRRNPATFLRSNPSSASGLLVASVMAGVGVTAFDLIASRIFPQSSLLARVGVKLGGAWFFQSAMGAKVPVLGKYKNDIALVLGVLGAVDLLRAYVLPVVNSTVSNFTQGALQLIPAPAAAAATAPAATMSGAWRRPTYY